MKVLTQSPIVLILKSDTGHRIKVEEPRLHIHRSTAIVSQEYIGDGTVSVLVVLVKAMKVVQQNLYTRKRQKSLPLTISAGGARHVGGCPHITSATGGGGGGKPNADDC